MEIKPQELRIGNLISSKINRRDQLKVLQLFGDSFQGDWGNSRGGFMYESCEGIALTPEWLEKLGFKRGDNVTANDAFYVKPVGVSELAVNPDNGVCWISNRNGSINNPACIDNVHQLQNLYFALTGEELAIDKQN